MSEGLGDKSLGSDHTIVRVVPFVTVFVALQDWTVRSVLVTPEIVCVSVCVNNSELMPSVRMLTVTLPT